MNDQDYDASPDDYYFISIEINQEIILIVKAQWISQPFLVYSLQGEEQREKTLKFFVVLNYNHQEFMCQLCMNPATAMLYLKASP